MKVFQVEAAESQENTQFFVRAVDEKAACEAYLAKVLAGEMIMVDPYELAAWPRLEIKATLEDDGQAGVLFYGEPDVAGYDLEQLDTWKDALADGYEPGDDFEEFAQRRSGASEPQPSL